VENRENLALGWRDCYWQGSARRSLSIVGAGGKSKMRACSACAELTKTRPYGVDPDDGEDEERDGIPPLLPGLRRMKCAALSRLERAELGELDGADPPALRQGTSWPHHVPAAKILTSG